METTFGQLLDIGLYGVKARQGRATSWPRVDRQFADYLLSRKNVGRIEAGKLKSYSIDAVESWRTKGIFPKEWQQVAEAAVEYCAENGVVSRDWARNLLAAAGHPRPEPILERYFPRSDGCFELQERSNDEDLREFIRESKEFWAWGSSFSTHTAYLVNGGVLDNPLRSDGVRFLLVEPKGCAAKVAAFRAGGSLDDFSQRLKASLVMLGQRAMAHGGEKLMLKTIDYIGSTMYVFDPRSERGLMLLHLSKFHGNDPWDRPTLTIARHNNRVWFRHFIKEFEDAWQAAKEYHVPADSSGDDPSQPLENWGIVTDLGDTRSTDQ